MKNYYSTLLPLLLTGILVVTNACSGDRSPSPSGLLKLADQFYKTIVDDPVDRTRGEYQVVLGYLEMEQPEKAREVTESITNWKQADGYVELARYYYTIKDNTIASEYIAQAEMVMKEFKGWHQSYLSGKIVRLKAEFDQSEQSDLKLKENVDQYNDVFLLALSDARELAQLGFFQEALEKVKAQEVKHNNLNHLRHQIAETYHELEKAAADQDNMDYREIFIQAGLDFLNAQPEIAQKYLRSRLVERVIAEGDLALAKELATPIINEYEEKLSAQDQEETLFESTAALGIVNLHLEFGEKERARAHLIRIAKNVGEKAVSWKVPRDISNAYLGILVSTAKLEDPELFNQQLGLAMEFIQKSADMKNLRIGARMSGELACGIYQHAELVDQANWKRLRELLSAFEAIAETREFKAFRERI